MGWSKITTEKGGHKQALGPCMAIWHATCKACSPSWNKARERLRRRLPPVDGKVPAIPHGHHTNLHWQ